jgi:hypothetical protein
MPQKFIGTINTVLPTIRLLWLCLWSGLGGLQTKDRTNYLLLLCQYFFSHNNFMPIVNLEMKGNLASYVWVSYTQTQMDVQERIYITVREKKNKGKYVLEMKLSDTVKFSLLWYLLKLRRDISDYPMRHPYFTKKTRFQHSDFRKHLSTSLSRRLTPES